MLSMDDFEAIEIKLQKLIQALDSARAMLDAELRLDLKDIEVQWAIAEVMGAKDNAALIEMCPDAETIVRLLQGYNFKRFRPERLERIEIDEVVIPEDVSRILEEQKIKRNGRIWDIHKNDADPFPSNPHAHNYGENIKLDLSNGNFFRHRKYLGKMKKKHLIALRNLVKHSNLPPLAVGDETDTD